VTEDLIRDERITAMGLLAEACGGLAARLSVQLAEHHLAPVEFEVLLRLARSPERRLRMTDLAAQAALSTSGVTRIVDRLERAGLVCRTRCPADRRSCFAVLTSAGEQRLATDVPDIVDAIERWFTGLLTAAQLDAFAAALQTVRDTVHPHATAGAQQ